MCAFSSHRKRSEPLDYALVFTDAERPCGVKKAETPQLYDAEGAQKEGELVKRLAAFAHQVARRRSWIKATVATLDRLCGWLVPDVAMHYGRSLGLI